MYFCCLTPQLNIKSLKLGIHLNLKAASLRLSRYHLISATITHRTLLYTVKDIHAWRQLCIAISNDMSQGKPSSWSQYHCRRISLGLLQKFTTKKWFTSLHSPVSFQSLHRTNPQIFTAPPSPSFYISSITSKWQVMIILTSQHSSQQLT